MKRFKSLHKSGRFSVSPGVEVDGELFVSGRETRLELTSDTYFDTHNLTARSICGTLSDRSRVSLLGCVTTQGPGTGPTLEGGSYSFSTVLPDLVVMGNEFLTADDEKITALHVVLQDAHSVFYDFHAYGEMRGEVVHKLSLIKQHGSAEASFSDDPAWPMIFYYTGKSEIFKCDTTIGAISAVHTPTFRTAGVRGVRIKDRISLRIEFRSRVTSGLAIEALYVLLRFFELLIGRTQNIQGLRFSVARADGEARSQDVYMRMRKRVKRGSDDRGPSPSEVLIRGAHEPDTLASVLKRYVNREEAWRSARIRLGDAMSSGNSYSADRVIAAANMFDLIPRSASATTLRLRVLDRAQLVLDHAKGRFPELGFILEKAVECRNAFVHGPRPTTNMSSMYEAMPFLCNALEFVFGTSDLIDAGWDLHAWLGRGSSMEHPYGSFAVNYSLGLSNLKKLFA